MSAERIGVQTDALEIGRRTLAVRRFVPCRTVVLVGLMGAGKTKIGRRLAIRLDLPFFDSDQEIEAAAGETIEEIFANRGERRSATASAASSRGCWPEPVHVLATGGGAFMDPATRAVIARRGVSVWLRADLDVLVAAGVAPRQPAPAESGRPARDAGRTDRAAASDLCGGRCDRRQRRRVARSNGQRGDCGARGLPSAR